jgi:hypothetical protein
MTWLAPETVLALLGAGSGGFFLKLLDNRYRIKEKSMDAGTVLRTELHARVVELQAEVKAWQTEMVTWRNRYYRLFAIAVMQRAAAEAMRLRMQDITGESIPELPKIEEDITPPGEIK